jgi:hypothetical protein
MGGNCADGNAPRAWLATWKGIAPCSILISLYRKQATIHSHQNLSGRAVPDDVMDWRDAGPTA